MLRLAIQRPIAISMLFLAMVLIGALSFVRLPVDLLPGITYPRLTIVTTYEDIPAEDLERLVTQPIEEVVTALSGVRRVVSRTREGISTITVEYEWGTQMDFANLHLREAVDRVAFRDDFPEDSERPTILRWDPLSRPIAILTLQGAEDNLRGMTDFATDVVKPALQQVDGISQAEVVGGADREILVEVDVEKMNIYGVTVEDIQDALARSNVSFPGGQIRQGPLHLSLRIAGEFESLEDIEATDITRAGRSAVRVSDIARVYDTVKEAEGVTLLADEPVVSLLLYKEPEANTIQVTREMDTSLTALAEDYGNFTYDFVYRDADYVSASFNGLVQSLVVGAVLAFFVLFFFLYNVRSPLVVGIAIPVSIFVTFGLLYFGDVKLNLMSLGGLSLAAGMLVDNAIVVLENINRHIREGRPRDDEAPADGSPARERADDRDDAPAIGDAPATGDGETVPTSVHDGASDAAIEHALATATLTTRKIEDRRFVANAAVLGTTEVARAVMAATLTTVAVFFPVVYVPGIAGAFFRDQALTVTFSLLVSVATALLLQPMLAARLLQARPGPPSGLFKLFDSGFRSFYRVYHRVLVGALRRPLPLLLALVIALAGAALVGRSLQRSLMPERSSGDFRVELELPSGTPLEETAGAVAMIGGWLQDVPEVKAVFSQVGRTERTLASLQQYTGPNTATVRVIVEPGRGARQRGDGVQKALTARLHTMSDVQFAFREDGIGLQELLASDEAPFTMSFVSEDPFLALDYAEEMFERLVDEGVIEDGQLDRVLGTPNVVVRLDAEEILRSGLDPDRIARDLRNRISGVEATTFNEIDKRIDIAVRIPRNERRDLSAALNAPVRLSSGETVPLRNFLVVSEERPVRELTRRNQQRMVTVSADLQFGQVEKTWREAMNIAATMDLPPSVRIVSGGERSEMIRSFVDLGWAMLLAVMLVYMILAAQFESFVDPLLIASVIPIGLAGSMFTLGITGGSINMLSIIGMLALLGIAVNDAIIKIDTMRRLRSDGMDGYKAILEASRLRLRPILMTSATTVLAMIPMAIGIGSGEQLQRPLAIAIIGGLTMTTALTLIYTPLLYMLVHRIRRPAS